MVVYKFPYRRKKQPKQSSENVRMDENNFPTIRFCLFLYVFFEFRSAF